MYKCMYRYEAGLATAVDGGSGVLCIDSIHCMPSQWLHVVPPSVRSTMVDVNKL